LTQDTKHTRYKQITRSTIERIYVKVNSDCDTTGQIHPKSITWADGRTFSIDSVRDFRPANTVGANLPGDCYTVVIGGHEKHLSPPTLFVRKQTG